MNIVFMGTPDFSVPSLSALYDRFGKEGIKAVVTQPDRPKGRGKAMQCSPVKIFASERGIPVLQPERVRKNDEFYESLKALDPDLFIVIAYGQILPTRILNIPKYCLNAHASLLPRYRGSAPMQWALINGEERTGVTIMYMDKGIDTGDMMFKREVVISPDDTHESIHDKLSMLSAECLIEAVELIQSGKETREKQDETLATYAPMLDKDMGLIDWNNDASKTVNLIRGLRPWPGTYTSSGLKIWRAKVCSCVEGIPVGHIAALSPEGAVINTPDGGVLVTEVQAVNKQRMSTADYARGKRLNVGDEL